jgi:hypothetical protein
MILGGAAGRIAGVSIFIDCGPAGDIKKTETR